MSNNAPHRRQNLLTGDWVLVSPQRMGRPWQGEMRPAEGSARPQHDPGCYLCPRNARVGGVANPDYVGTWVFPNDFPALVAEPQGAPATGLFREAPVAGEAHVLCYAADHSATLARMDESGRRAVVEAWCDLSAKLGARWAHVQMFENKGAMMGASSPHPHGQAWASNFIPTEVAREDERQRAHLGLLADIVAAEDVAEARIVARNAHWLAVVPHWAAWPFETLLVAREPVARLEDLGAAGRAALAEILGVLLPAYDALFQTDFPYSMGWHGAPHVLGTDCAHWRLHAHFYPPLLRSAEIRKHMVGFELLAEAQRDLTPEAAAQRLRALTP